MNDHFPKTDTTVSGRQGCGLIRLICFTIGVLILFASPASAAECELKMGWEPWPPYQYVDEKGRHTGLDTDLVTAIAKESNCRLIFYKIEWKAHLNRLKTGSLDMATSASRTPERLKYAYFSKPYRSETVNLYVRKGESHLYPFKKPSDMIGKDFDLGIVYSYFYGPEFEVLRHKPEFKSQLEEIRNNEHNLFKLINNRIDGFLLDSIVAATLIKKFELGNRIEQHPMHIYSTNIYLMFSRNAVKPETVKMFNEGLTRLKKSPFYQEILNRYLNQD